MNKYIAYLSKQSHHMTDTELKKMLKEARKNNETKKITGMLVHIDGSFIQFIEGPALLVEDLYTKIKKDPRHNDIMLIAEGNYETRYFTSWSMAFKKLDGEINTLEGYRPFEPDVLFKYPTSQQKDKLPALTLLQNFIRDIKD